jgi:hypothetical protein
MKAAFAMTVLVWVGALASQGNADFSLWYNEQLTVNTSHSLGMLYDESRAWIVSGGSVTKLYAYDTSTVDMADGSVSHTLFSRNTSTVNISGGFVNHVESYETSAVNISGGTVSFVDLRDSSIVRILDGSVTAAVANDSSIVNISGDSVSHSCQAYEAGVMNISGGSVPVLGAHATSVVNLTGGSLSELEVHDTSLVTFFVRDVRLGDGLSLDGDRLLGTGVLSGEWLDDAPRWMVDIQTNASGATILVITPTPGDANLDGTVDLQDFGVLKANFGGPSGWTGGDFNADGTIDLQDFGLLMQICRFNECLHYSKRPVC